MKRYLFIGPSLPGADDLLAGEDVTVLPPAAAGDLLKLAPRPGDLVGIVDGYFHQSGAVRHKEILAVLDTGSRYSARRASGLSGPLNLTGSAYRASEPYTAATGTVG